MDHEIGRPWKCNAQYLSPGCKETFIKDEFSTAVEYYDTPGNDHTATESMLHKSDVHLAYRPHVYGLFWTPEKLEWYLDGVKIREEGAEFGTQHLIPQDIPLFWSVESRVLDWLMGGPNEAPHWPEQCGIEYIRHYAIDRINENCMPKDKIEQEKCEKMYQGKDQNIHSIERRSKI